ncbi:MAG: glycosyltransferase family 9 protein [Deltaproteobacteria bacterium]|jgi:ADP-heptose:LPS heptosyltransferase|nr:glycosyltransferase family 9 protein [Deltaproteobacteria bacterium]
MISTYYQEQWQRVKETADPEACRELAEEVALAFLDRHYFNNQFESAYVKILCEMATAFSRDDLNRIGASALFGIVVESLCDNFEELQTAAYNRLMSYIIDYCANLPGNEAFRERMRHFGMRSFDDLYRRIERLRKTSGNYRDLVSFPRKIIVLSRVTIGADVAVTSVLVQRLSRTFPDAEIIVIGGDKINSLYTSHPKISVQSVLYSRRGGLLERLQSWFEVLKAIDHAKDGLSADQYLLVDPDSRLSQLGVLPLCDDRSYLFFSSRSSQMFPMQLSISEMVNHWYNQLTGESRTCYPSVWLDSSLRSHSDRFVGRLRGSGAKHVVAVNFGVGGNSRKRVDDIFEKELILELLKEPQTVVLLDKGFGEEEVCRSDALLACAAKAGYKVVDTVFSNLDKAEPDAKLYGIDAGIDQAAALIGHSDEFIGYDSACQHIAAAQEVPTFTIFAGSNNTRFVRRWCPYGLGRREIIHVDTLTQPPVYNRKAVLLRLMHARSQ